MDRPDVRVMARIIYAEKIEKNSRKRDMFLRQGKLGSGILAVPNPHVTSAVSPTMFSRVFLSTAAPSYSVFLRFWQVRRSHGSTPP